jgi:SAM-dependent methyltransferase
VADQDERIVTQHRVWEDWAQADPLWAIMSDPARRGNKWKLDEFFATGVEEIDQLAAELAERGLAYGHGRAMDFGCGVGRLTQALAARFDECDGVDISETMINLAREYNAHGDSCRYHVNREPNLALLPDASFDLVYSSLVLQHNPPEIAQHYIAEFVRLLKPGGIAVFDMPDTPGGTAVRLPEDSHRAALRIASPVPVLTAGAEHTVRIEVTNTSHLDWPSGHIVKAGNHWKDAETGQLLQLDDGRTRLPAGLPAGGRVSVDLTISAPATPGRYLLEVDLVEEGVTWFAGAGSPVLSAEVTVKAAAGPRWSRRGRDNKPEPALANNEPQPYEMNGLSFAVVEATIISSGGVLTQSRLSERAGAEWLTYRYFVTREPATTAPA